MLHLLRRLFSRTARREIFTFWDGHRHRQVDPLTILRATDEHPIWKPATDLKLMQVDSELGRAAQRATLAGIRDIFGIRPLADDGSGLTEDETMMVWVRYCDFLAALKKNGSLRPTGSPPTESGPPASPEDTNRQSASGSTASEPVTAATSPS
jgi:hypothetical protein